MTRSDKWKNRPCVSGFWAFKTELILAAKKQGLETLPQAIKSLDFYIAMPESWTKKKKSEMDGKPHGVKPDIDNILKGIMDSLCLNDQHIHTIGRLTKTWAYEGKIEIEL
jgi:Holliday junction resolvase RusA-like endonuclease